MFHFLLPALLSYNVVLILAAVIPAVFLMIKVYRSDRLELESHGMLLRLVVGGVLSALIALVSEWVLSGLLQLLVPSTSALFDVLLYFVVVAVSEEGAKYFMLRRRSWSSPEFNCQYDGVVYAVFVSLGFALWENISYVMHYGFQTALVRAVTAIPGHACFGVFMGVWYGMAKRREGAGDAAGSKRMRVRALLIPALLHGFYDFIASRESGAGSLVFIVFVILMFVTAYRLVRHVSDNDSYIQSYRFGFWG